MIRENAINLNGCLTIIRLGFRL